MTKKRDTKLELMLVIFLFPVATFLAGLGIGASLSAGDTSPASLIAPVAGLIIAFVVVGFYYANKIHNI
ncbi:hypothetical protein [Gilvimarinus xylanilyticus]|uniref:Uncharacterized protein n=1 Tax=Gilvimarinus xylanilyticus TaxID=2944139 RepID=A0A9X2KX21_9GAMM|nr:hypothetical protein [Gilvimarinus xylanilyticus]MCP8900360.1 hypothetical protein [Gilvimarinus xylanilyticus]